MKHLFVICIALNVSLGFAQTGGNNTQKTPAKERKVIAFSGYALTADSLMGIPFAHISIVNHGVVGQAGPDGYFSFAAREGDTLLFSSIGYKTEVYVIPPVLLTDKYSVVQLMSKEEYYHPPIFIYPWRREDFPTVFMNTHPAKDAYDRARENLDRKTLAEIGEKLERDGEEATQIAIQNNSLRTYYYGQTPPQNIFNPLAWAEFIKAWKRGDFKKKDDNSSQDSNNGN